MDLDNVAEDDVQALTQMGFSPRWNAYALSYFHGARDQAVQFMLEHNDRLQKMSLAPEQVTIDDIIALGFSAVDITTAMVENDMNMEKAVQFLLLRKHLLSADSLAFQTPSSPDSSSPQGPRKSVPTSSESSSRGSGPRRLSNAPLPAAIPMPQSDSERGSLLPPRTQPYAGRSLPLRFDLPVEVDPDVFFSHPEDVQLEQQAMYSMDIARGRDEDRRRHEQQLNAVTAFVDDAPAFDVRARARTYWVHEGVVHRHPTLRLGIQLRGPPDWHLVVVELKSGPDGEPGPAEIGGLEVGDILLAVNGHQIRGLKDLSYLTTVTKQASECLLRVTRAEDQAVRDKLVKQAMADPGFSQSVARVRGGPHGGSSSSSSLNNSSGSGGGSGGGGDAAGNGSSSRRQHDAALSAEAARRELEAATAAAAAAQERERERRAAEAEAEAVAAQQHRDVLAWLRQTTPASPASWRACFLALSPARQQHVYVSRPLSSSSAAAVAFSSSSPPPLCFSPLSASAGLHCYYICVNVWRGVRASSAGRALDDAPVATRGRRPPFTLHLTRDYGCE